MVPRASVCLLLVAGPLFGQQGGLVDVAVRAAEAEIKLAIKEAQRLASTNPQKATEKLQDLQKKLVDNRIFSADRREQLNRIIADRLRVIAAGPPTEEQIPIAPRNVVAEQKAAELAKLKAGMTEASELRKSGQTEAANQRFAEMLKVFSKDFIATTDIANQQTIARKSEFDAVRQEKERATVSALNIVDRTAIMPTTDIQFPKGWKEKMAKRKADNAPTAEELRVLRALQTTIDARFKDSRLEDVVDYLSTLTGLPIILDKAGLEELKLTYDTPVNFSLKKPISTRTAMRAIFRGLGLTFVVNDGIVYVTTVERARAYLVVKTYSVGDLTIPIDPFSGFEELNVINLIDVIVSVVDPESWETRGGLGVIRYYKPTHALVIRQSAEVHTMLKGSLGK